METDNSNAMKTQKIAVHLGNKEPMQRAEAPQQPTRMSLSYIIFWHYSWTTAVVHALLYNSGRMQPNYGAHVIKVRKIVIVLISLLYHQIQQPIPELRIINFHNFLTNND